MSVRVIGIGGGTGSGKSTIANALAERLDAAVMRIDDYYRPFDHLTFAEREKINFDAPESIDHHLLHDHLSRLVEGQPVEKPHYDFSRHTRAVFGDLVHPKPVVIVEGLFALHWAEINRLYHTSIFVETPRDIRFSRRLKRDIEERGRDEADVTFRFHSHVNPMHEIYVQPTATKADLVVYGHHEFEHTFAQAMAHVAEAGPVVL
ncbi:MAG: uridine kinase [Armatimonadetes bacterium]|nr:uridine kinase [Armatimonadota bacterium]